MSTPAIDVVGWFLLGLLVTVARFRVSDTVLTAPSVGLIGGFTT